MDKLTVPPSALATGMLCLPVVSGLFNCEPQLEASITIAWLRELSEKQYRGVTLHLVNTFDTHVQRTVLNGHTYHDRRYIVTIIGN